MGPTPSDMAWTLRAKTIVQTRLPFGRRSARRSPSNPLAHDAAGGATERGDGTADRAGLRQLHPN